MICPECEIEPSQETAAARWEGVKACKEGCLDRLAHVVNSLDLANKRSEIQIHGGKGVDGFHIPVSE